MTDRPQFAPSVDGARDVMRRARARRRRQTLVTTGCLAVAGAVAGIVLVAAPGVGAGADRLTVVPASPGPNHQQSAPANGARPGHPNPAPSPSTRAGSQLGVPGSGNQAPGHSGSFGQSAPTDSPTPYAPVKRHSANAPITRTTVGYNSACDATYDVQGWCVLYTGPTTARRKHNVVLSMELCRPAVVGDGTVRFSSTRQVDFSVYDGYYNKVWQAGQGLKYKNTPSSLVVHAGTCLRWTSTWDTIAPSGFYVPPGSYSPSYLVDSNISYSTSGGSLALTD